MAKFNDLNYIDTSEEDFNNLLNNVQPVAQYSPVAEPTTAVSQIPRAQALSASTPNNDVRSQLIQQIKAQAPGVDWNQMGIDRSEELADLMLKQGITNLGEIGFKSNPAIPDGQPGAYGYINGETGQWTSYPPRSSRGEDISVIPLSTKEQLNQYYDPQNQSWSATGGDGMVRPQGYDENQLNRNNQITINGKDYGYLGDYNNDNSYGNKASQYLQGNLVGWSARGHGNTGYNVKQDPNTGKYYIAPDWASSSDIGIAQDIAKAVAIAAAIYFTAGGATGALSAAEAGTLAASGAAEGAAGAAAAGAGSGAATGGGLYSLGGAGTLTGTGSGLGISGAGLGAAAPGGIYSLGAGGGLVGTGSGLGLAGVGGGALGGAGLVGTGAGLALNSAAAPITSLAQTGLGAANTAGLAGGAAGAVTQPVTPGEVATQNLGTQPATGAGTDWASGEVGAQGLGNTEVAANPIANSVAEPVATGANAVTDEQLYQQAVQAAAGDAGASTATAGNGINLGGVSASSGTSPGLYSLGGEGTLYGTGNGLGVAGTSLADGTYGLLNGIGGGSLVGTGSGIGLPANLGSLASQGLTFNSLGQLVNQLGQVVSNVGSTGGTSSGGTSTAGGAGGLISNLANGLGGSLAPGLAALGAGALSPALTNILSGGYFRDAKDLINSATGKIDAVTGADLMQYLPTLQRQVQAGSMTAEQADAAVQNIIQRMDPAQAQSAIQAVVGSMDPARAEAYQQTGSLMNNVTSDSLSVAQQRASLDQLGNIANNNGLTEADRAQLQATINQNNANAAQQRGAQLNALQQKGLAGSGAELAIRAAGGQNTANANAIAGANVATSAQSRALDALKSKLTGASNLNSQLFNQDAEKAKAQDVINQFNTQAKNTIAAQNAQFQQQANQQNFNTANTVAGANADRAQQAALANQQAQQQASQINATQANQIAAQNAERAQQTALANAQARQTANQQNFQMANQIGAKNTDIANEEAKMPIQAAQQSFTNRLNQANQSATQQLAGANQLNTQGKIQADAATNLASSVARAMAPTPTGTNTGSNTGGTATPSAGTGLSGSQQTGQDLRNVGSAIGLIGQIGNLFSDERLKTDKSEMSDDEVDKMLGELTAYKYRYKGSAKPQQGVLAQDVEKGSMKNAVVNTPAGKMIAGNEAIGQTLAAMGNLAERIRRLEGKQ